jgi:hypothetical protein
MAQGGRRLVWGAGAVVATGLVLLGAASGTPWHVDPPSLPALRMPVLSLPPQPTQQGQQGLPADDQPLRQTHIGAWAGWVLVALAAALVIFLLVRWLMKRQLPVPGWRDDTNTPGGVAGADDEVRQAVAEGVDAALTRLEASGPPRDAVVAAWLELEAAAGRSGVERDPAQTPTEFTATLLAATPAPAAAVEALRRRYHAARFSEHAVTGADVAAARDALARIGAALHRPVPVGTGDAR